MIFINRKLFFNNLSHTKKAGAGYRKNRSWKTSLF